MADEMKELRGAVFDLIPDGVSVVALDEIEVDDMAPKTRNVKDVVSSTNSPAWLSEIAAASASATR